MEGDQPKIQSDAPASPRPLSDGDIVPTSAERLERLVDEAAEESFPASDPPSYWARVPARSLE